MAIGRLSESTVSLPGGARGHCGIANNAKRNAAIIQSRCVLYDSDVRDGKTDKIQFYPDDNLASCFHAELVCGGI